MRLGGGEHTSAMSHSLVSPDTAPAARLVGSGGEGGREEAFFFGPGGERMLGLLHLPAGPAAGAVLILSPIEAELLKNYPREVELARDLAARGMAVLRFHYRGAGNSDGASARLTLDSMIEDGRAAAEILRETRGNPRVGFLGTRLGALAAAALAREAGGAPLVFWEPVLDGERYFRELLRYRLMYELKEWTPDRPRPSTEGLFAELREQGHVELFGMVLHRALYESLEGRPLEETLGDRTSPVLLVQMGGAASLRPELGRFVERLGARGVPVDDARVGGDIAWWFDMDEAADPDLIRATREWFLRQLATRDEDPSR